MLTRRWKIDCVARCEIVVGSVFIVSYYVLVCWHMLFGYHVVLRCTCLVK